MPRHYTPRVPRACATCGAAMMVIPGKIADGRGKFCSRVCQGLGRTRAGRIERICEHCTRQFSIIAYKFQLGMGRFCSIQCAQAGGGRGLPGALSHSWRGGRIINSEGYVLIHRNGHPLARVSGYVLEHRFVLYEVGVEIPPDHHVHHINGVKTDNRRENLEVLSNSEHQHRHLASH